MADEKKSIARVDFTITSAGGTVMYTEGQPLPVEVAKRFPQYVVGYTVPKAPAHDPSLPQKLTKLMAEKMEKLRLIAWFKQYYPGRLTDETMDQGKMVELAMEVQGG